MKESSQAITENPILEEPLPELFQASCDGMMLIDQRRHILAMNPAMEKLTGYPACDMVGKSQCGLMLRCQDLNGCSLWLRTEDCPGLKAMNELQPVQAAEYKLKRPAGDEIVVNTSYTPIQRARGGSIFALVIMRDITEQKRKEQQMALQAATDPLTNLPNRAALAKVGLKEVKRAGRYGHPLAVAMADLDGFKAYNDVHGHPAGDELLKILAMLLKSGSRAADFIARYGGDEFALILPETDAAVAIFTLQRLCRIIAQFPFFKGQSHFPGRSDVPIRISFGVAVFPQDGAAMEALLCRADYRLLQAKSEGGDRVVGP